MKKASRKDMNYNFASQKQPAKPMGHGAFANMPAEGMIKKFPMQPEYRAGIINSYTHNLDEISGIDENEC